MPSFRRLPPESLIAPLAVIVVFGMAASFGWVYFDDPVYYRANPLLGEASLLTRLLAAWTVAPEANWMPLTWSLAIFIDWIAEGSASAVHLVSVAIHATNAWLAWLVLRRFGASKWLAVAIACLWALHPMRSESVAWASSLKDVLSGCFALGMLALLAKEDREGTQDWPAFGLFVASLLSKQVLFVFPVALLLWDLRNSQHSWWKLAMSRWKWWVAGAAAAIVAWLVNKEGMSLGEVAAPQSFQQGIFRGLAAIGHQVCKLFLPTDLIPEYLIESATMSKAIVGFLLFINAAVASVMLLRRRGKISTWLFVAAVGLFFPLAGWIKSPMEFTADRLSYLPHFLGIGALVLTIKPLRIHAWIVGVAALVAGVVTMNGLPMWQDGDHLNARMLEVCPGHPTALQNRGVVRAEKGDFAGAFDDFSSVIKSHPERVSAWSNAVSALAMSGDLLSARQLLNEGIKRHPGRLELVELESALNQVEDSQS